MSSGSPARIGSSRSAEAAQEAETLPEPVLDLEDLALPIRLEDLDGVQRLVQDDLGAAHEARRIDLGRRVDAHLPAAREDVDGAVVVRREIHAERRRRLAELLDLLL